MTAGLLGGQEELMIQSQSQSDLNTLVHTHYKVEARLLGRWLNKALSPKARGPELRSSALNKRQEGMVAHL